MNETLPALAACLLAAAGARAAPGPLGPDDVYRLAGRHASRLAPEDRPYAQYLSLHAVTDPALRAKYLKATPFVVNSLNARRDAPCVPEVVAGSGGALVYFDLRRLGVEPKVFERLGARGGGPAPFPEPYWHLTESSREAQEDYSEEVPWGHYEEWAYGGWQRVPAERHQEVGRREQAKEPGVRWVTEFTKTVPKKRRRPGGRATVQGGWLERAGAIGLITLTGRQFPVFEWRWFVCNALVAPRYYEILGLTSVQDVEKFLGVDQEGDKRFGSQVRGAVLFSDVGRRNRVLERRPTRARYGRAPYWKSYDFKSSVLLANVLQDVLVEDADAFEVIFPLPCGLHGYAIGDAKGRLLDAADPDIAQMHGRGINDFVVRAGWSCMACHLAEKGYIAVDDEVAQLNRRPVVLLADHAARREPARGERIRQAYLSIDVNELVAQDGGFYDGQVRALGLTCAEAGAVVEEVVHGYLEEPVTPEELARCCGVTPERVMAAVEHSPGLDVAFVGLRLRRRQRRDQVEAGLGHLLQALYKEAPR